MDYDNGIWYANYKRRSVLRIGFPFDSQVTYENDGTPIYDRAISSAPLRQLIKKMLSNGVLPNPSTNLQVQPGTGMNVIVNPGFAVIEGGLKYEETQRTLAVQASHTMYDRIDTVVLRWNDNANSRSCDFYILQGVPAISPVRPTLNREGSVYEIGLADLFIVANSSAISFARITDTRYEAERCGIISSIAEFDSDTIYNQIQADLAGFKAEEQAGFLEWFETIKQQLSEDAAGNLQLQIDALKTSDTKNNTVSFGSGDEESPSEFVTVELLQSGEKHSSLFEKVSLMFKNVRRLIKLIGTNDISGLADGTLTGIVGELNKNMKSSYILGYLADNTTFSVNEETTMPLTIGCSYGDAFDISSGGIIVNKDCVAEISASAYFQQSAISSERSVVNIYIHKNTNIASRAVASVYSKVSAYYTVSTTPNIINLSKGDVLSLRISNQTTSGNIVGGYQLTRMVVKEII